MINDKRLYVVDSKISTTTPIIKTVGIYGPIIFTVNAFILDFLIELIEENKLRIDTFYISLIDNYGRQRYLTSLDKCLDQMKVISYEGYSSIAIPLSVFGKNKIFSEFIPDIYRKISLIENVINLSINGPVLFFGQIERKIIIIDLVFFDSLVPKIISHMESLNIESVLILEFIRFICNLFLEKDFFEIQFPRKDYSSSKPLNLGDFKCLFTVKK